MDARIMAVLVVMLLGLLAVGCQISAEEVQRLADERIATALAGIPTTTPQPTPSLVPSPTPMVFPSTPTPQPTPTP